MDTAVIDASHRSTIIADEGKQAVNVATLRC